MQHVGSSSLTRDRTRAPLHGELGDHQGSPFLLVLVCIFSTAALQPWSTCFTPACFIPARAPVLSQDLGPPYPGPFLAGIWGGSGGRMLHRRGDRSCPCPSSPGMPLPSSQHSLHTSKRHLLLPSTCQVIYSALYCRSLEVTQFSVPGDLLVFRSTKALLLQSWGVSSHPS